MSTLQFTDPPGRESPISPRSVYGGAAGSCEATRRGKDERFAVESTSLQLQWGDGLLNHTQTHTVSSVNQIPEDPADPWLVPGPEVDATPLVVPTVCDVGEG